ncbi:MAG: hypothetical protein ACR2JE_11400 [Acidobacteriaceae bacterium]
MTTNPTTISWDEVQRRLTPGLRIPYYNLSRRNGDRTFAIDSMKPNKLYVLPFSGALRPLTRCNFETVAEHWDDYNAEEVDRRNIPTFHTSYALSIIAYLLHHGSKT